jgi:hypothetical protein
MALSANRRAPGRRVVLVLDCLEDRATPAAFGMFGQTITDFVPARIDLDASAVGRFAIAAPMPVFSVLNAASPNDVPFGFFHPFSQNGFGISDSTPEAAPVPQPRPVTPPLNPAQILPEPELPAIPLPVMPRVDNDVPAPAPALEPPPALIRLPQAELPPPPQLEPPRSQVSEQAPDLGLDDAAVVTSTSNSPRKSFASIGVLTAAFSLMYTRNIRERRYDEAFAFGH